MSVPTRFQNRIVRYREVDPEQLIASPLNWRIHSAVQQAAMTGALDEIGWLVPVVIQDGTDYVIDGHMRVAIALRENESTVPAVDVDLDDDEAATAIATLDPIGAMAVVDREKYAELSAIVDTENAALRDLLDTITTGARFDVPSFPTEDFPKNDDTVLNEHCCPSCGHTWSE